MDSSVTAAASHIPRATYRLQFTKDFGFDEAARLAPYLKQLGISHVYASPYLKAQPGSSHGYDVVSHTKLNPELGTPESFARMCAVFKEHGIGQILDFVPNHMGIGGSQNALWLDVLEWGRESQHAEWFDIDWTSRPPDLQGKVLVPFLGDHYRAVLSAGELALRFDAESGAFAVWAYDIHKLPICPRHYALILPAEFGPLAGELETLSSEPRKVRQMAHGLKHELAQQAQADSAIATALAEAAQSFTGEKLDELIRQQNWRLSHFRTAADEANYRRFFNINELAGLRIERPDVFEYAHALVLRLLNGGTLDGLRLDHVDGLLDPKAYCLKLRESASRPFYLLVEKILSPGEELRSDWRVDGTTGYEFTNLLTGVLIDPDGEPSLTQFYRSFTGTARNYDRIARDSKLFIIENELAAELDRLAREAIAIARSAPNFLDFSFNAIRRALKHVMAGFEVYRSYIDENGPNPEDRERIAAAVSNARAANPLLDMQLFDFLGRVLSLDASAGDRPDLLRFVMRLQQVTGPVMAKGIEDTAFYRYNRLLALNEVGGAPERFGVSMSEFHKANAERWPSSMLATATHDTKRGEDARARLAALSELKDEWPRSVFRWSKILRKGWPEEQPDRNDEYAFYQLLIAAWPAELSTGEPPEPHALEDLQERIAGAMTKAMREAKVRTTWAQPNVAYEKAMVEFIAHALAPQRPNRFLNEFAAFQARVARLGMLNSLIQTVLKLTLPGVPDIYQGSELWNLDLVDPDNRRPIDFERRKKFLERLASAGERPLSSLMNHWQDGEIKLLLTHRLLALRKRHPLLFRDGAYLPLEARGSQSARICAYARQHQNDVVVVAAALYPNRSLTSEAGTATAIPLPQVEQAGWRNLIDESVSAGASASVAAEQLFAACPVAVLLPAASDYATSFS